MNATDWLHLGLALAAIFIPFALGFLLVGHSRCPSVAFSAPCGALPSQKYNTLELHGGLSLVIPFQDAWQVQLHAGHTSVRANYGDINPSYSDWRMALAKSWDTGWNGSIAAVGANNARMYRPSTGGLSATDDKTRALNRTSLVLQIGKSF